MKQWTFFLLALLIVSGCSIAPEIPKDSLLPATGRSITLTAPVKFKPTSGPTAGVTLTLMPGDYQATLKNSEGVFYKGEQWCIVQEEWKGTYVRGGGIWVPTDKDTKQPRIFADGRFARVDPSSLTVESDLTKSGDNRIAEWQFQQTVINSTSAKASPVSGAVGYALGMAIVEWLAKDASDSLVFISDPIPVDIGIYAELRGL